MRKLHIVPTTGPERTIMAPGFSIDHSGVLSVEGADGAIVLAYGPGAWQYVEVEILDDRG